MRTPLEQRIFNAHRNIQQVIYNENSPAHQVWVKNGIPLEEDLGSLQQFTEWVVKRLGPPPFPEARLVRKDQSRGYLRKNLEWNSHKIQGQRLLRTARIKFRGRTQGVKAWAEELGISYNVIYHRYCRGTLNLKQLVKEYA
jgi:hypothetical protein